MQINNLWLSTLWKGVFALLCAAALIVDFGFTEGRAHWYILNYYTVLSNLACLLFFSSAFGAGVRAIARGESGFAWHPRVEGAVVFCISVTGIIYATMLAPTDIAAGEFFNFENLMLHYAGPAMVIADWLLFAPKRSFRAFDPLLWLLAPLGYFGYILVRSIFFGPIGATGSRFPYAFIDPAVQGGLGGMVRSAAFVGIAMTALGYIIYSIDHAPARR